ncbi:MAG: hypothetical protein WD669_03170 [Pirellulales bacterium]
MSDSIDNLDPTAPASGGVDFTSAAYLEARRQAMIAAAEATGFRGIDFDDPKSPAGHAYAIRKSTWLTSEFRRVHRKGAMDITPQDVVDVLNEAGVKSWVLMGLHGYLGYMPEPRATQDVDVMVWHRERQKAKKAISARWPSLTIRSYSQVIRFGDPADLDTQGRPKQVIDLMAPFAPFQELIMKEYVVVDDKTKHRLPTVEAAIVSKYAAMVSAFRDRDKKEQDAVDFRRLVRANYDQLRREDLRRLAGLIWEGGAHEIDQFVETAVTDAPFPI